MEMAGKVKKKGDDAPQSKTARASLRTGGAKAEFIAAADAPRIVPLGGGRCPTVGPAAPARAGTGTPSPPATTAGMGQGPHARRRPAEAGRGRRSRPAET